MKVEGKRPNQTNRQNNPKQNMQTTWVVPNIGKIPFNSKATYVVEKCLEICTAESVFGDVLFKARLNTTSVKNGLRMGKSTLPRSRRVKGRRDWNFLPSRMP